MRPSLLLLLSACLLLTPAAARAQKADAREELKAAASKAAALRSYTFYLDGPGKGAKPVEGKYEEGQPVFFLADKIEFFKKGAAVAYKEGDKWQRSKTGTQSDPLRILGAVAKVRRAALPHEELAGIEKYLKQIKKVLLQDKSRFSYSAELTDEGVQKFAPTEFRTVARWGHVTVAVDREGQVTGYSIAIRVSGRLGNAEVEGTPTRTVVLSGHGKTRVEVPEAARKILD